MHLLLAFIPSLFRELLVKQSSLFNIPSTQTKIAKVRTFVKVKITFPCFIFKLPAMLEEYVKTLAAFLPSVADSIKTIPTSHAKAYTPHAIAPTLVKSSQASIANIFTQATSLATYQRTVQIQAATIEGSVKMNEGSVKINAAYVKAIFTYQAWAATTCFMISLKMYASACKPSSILFYIQMLDALPP
jgi:hypothetical protein